jgi:tRNA modification GTPase
MLVPGGLPSGDDTIVALATPAGRGALGVLRVSGPRALAVLQALTGRACFTPRMATRARLVHPTTRAPLDDALVTWFPAPRSFTGEETAELSVHGGVAVCTAVLGACLAAGARLAEPGEFTRRAVLAGKLDLLQAEAIADLIDARSQALHRAALEQLDGGLSRRLQALREECLGLEALLAYDIDFPEEDDGPVSSTRMGSAVAGVLAALDDLLATAPSVPLLRDGAIVVLAGAPNAGKSSLLNALSGEARALVTEIPGTTRDAIEVLLDTAGVPLRLVDTAGLRETTDLVERLGIEVSARWLARAHVVLACGETDAEVLATVRVVRAMAPAREVPVVGVLTKVDAMPVREALQSTAPDEAAAVTATVVEPTPVAAMVRTSAEQNTGLDALLRAVQSQLAVHYGVVEPEVPRLTRERHHAAVRLAREELAAFRDAWNGGTGVPALVAAVHVRAAVAALDEVIGTVSLEDVLDRLFRDFCVGK